MARSKTDLAPYLALENHVLGKERWQDAIPVEELQKRLGKATLTEQDLVEAGVIAVGDNVGDSTFLHLARLHVEAMVDSGKFSLSPGEWATLWEEERIYIDRDPCEIVDPPTDLWGKRLRLAVEDHYKGVCDSWERAGRTTSSKFYRAVFRDVLIPHIDAAREAIVAAYVTAEDWDGLDDPTVQEFSKRIVDRYITLLKNEFSAITGREALTQGRLEARGSKAEKEQSG